MKEGYRRVRYLTAKAGDYTALEFTGFNLENVINFSGLPIATIDTKQGLLSLTADKGGKSLLARTGDFLLKNGSGDIGAVPKEIITGLFISRDRTVEEQKVPEGEDEDQSSSDVPECDTGDDSLGDLAEDQGDPE